MHNIPLIYCSLLAMPLTALGSTPADSVMIDSIIMARFSLGEVVITGTRAPRLLKDTPVQTRLISAKDIEKSDATNIEDLLQQEMPGVEFSYAMNQQVHMNIGGFGGQSVLFLIDGERLAGETMDDVDFSRLDMNNVERIEIVRGASSALYGSNAGGGVINIITRRATRPFSANFSVRVARHADQRYTTTLSCRRRTVSNTLAASFSSVENYDVKNGPNPDTKVVSTIYGNRTCNISDRISWNPTGRFRLSGHAGYFFRQVERTTDSPERYRDYSGAVRAGWQFGSGNDLNLSYSFDQYDKSTLYRLTRLDIRNYSNVQNSMRATYIYTTRRGDMLTAGIDYLHDYLMNSKLNGRTHRQNSADMFAQYDRIIDDRWEAVAALRYDYFSDGNLSRLTPKLSLRYSPRQNLNLRFSYGMGFRAPTLKEKYYEFDMAGIWIVKGNPALRPEQSHNFNLSADFTRRNCNVTVTTYYNSVTDKIATGLPYCLPGEGNQPYLDYVNLSRFRVYGGELTLQGAWDCGISARISYAFTHEVIAKDKDGNEANNQYIPARPHSLTARVDWNHTFSRGYVFSAGLNGRWLSHVTNREYVDYYDLEKGTVNVHYPGYTIWKLTVSQQLFSKLKITLAIDNLFNYRPKYYYLNSPLTDGCNFMAGIRLDI